TCFLDAADNWWNTCAVHRRVQIYNGSDSGASTDLGSSALRYHQSTLLKDTVIEVVESWFTGRGISLGGHADLHVFHGGTVTGLRYRDEILDPYVAHMLLLLVTTSFLMDDNARPHRAGIVEGSIWRITVWNEWNGQLDL
ncbi:HTH_Tnp_Tc3_2 domain-containing protein, partial [Trichonephila clavipes]